MGMKNLYGRLKGRFAGEYEYLRNVKNFGMDNVRFMKEREKINRRLGYPMLQRDENYDRRMREELRDEKGRFLILLSLAGCGKKQAAESIASALDQVYDNARIVVFDFDGIYGRDGMESMRQSLPEYLPAERVEYIFCEGAHPAEVLNKAVDDMGKDEDEIFLAQRGVKLSPYTLGLILLYKRLGEISRQSLVYSDELVRDADGKLQKTVFKPDFGKYTIRGENYIGDSFCVSAALWRQAGGLDAAWRHAFAYDLILRVGSMEKGREGTVFHIPQPLLAEWKEQPTDGAVAEEEENVLRRYLRRQGEEGEICSFLSRENSDCCRRVRYEIAGEPMISILIPNKDHVDILGQCVSSILAKSTYQNYEILIIENNSEEQETFDFYRELEKDPRIRVIVCETDWNYSYINNYGAKYCRGEYLLLLNNDTEVIAPDWMEQMLMYAQKEDVGAVGAKLLYPDQTVQHAGVTLGIRCVAGHAFHGWPIDSDGYMNRLITVQNLTAVTAACMMIPRHVFEEIGGFDEEYKVAFNDTDLCMRIRKAGYQVIFNPYAVLYHYESKSRGNDEQSKEKLERFNRESMRFQRQWCRELTLGDPFYNRNLSIWNDDFTPVEPYV